MNPIQNNVLFVTVDCLRQDFVEEDYADTPFIDSLRDDGIEFTNLYSTTTTTTPAVAALFTGSYSERNGVHSLREAELDPDVQTIAELFEDNGFETAALVTGPLVSETKLDRGFDHYWYRDQDETLVGRWFDTAVEHLSSLSNPFFAYLHLWEIHDPITVPEKYDSADYGRTSYARGLAALDSALEELVENIPSDTLIVLHGDHGESISHRNSSIRRYLKSARRRLRYNRGVDTRRFEKLVNRLAAPFDPSYTDHFIEDGHGENVYDYVTNVPFILSSSENISTTIDTQVRQIDILPTLLDIFDLPSPEGIDGESLLPVDSVNERPAYIRACGESLFGRENWQKAVRANGKKLVKFPGQSWEAEYYDLRSDPQELSPSSPPRKNNGLYRHFPDNSLGDAELLEIDDRLADLGYL